MYLWIHVLRHLTNFLLTDEKVCVQARGITLSAFQIHSLLLKALPDLDRYCCPSQLRSLDCRREFRLHSPTTLSLPVIPEHTLIGYHPTDLVTGPPPPDHHYSAVSQELLLNSPYVRPKRLVITLQLLRWAERPRKAFTSSATPDRCRRQRQIIQILPPEVEMHLRAFLIECLGGKHCALPESNQHAISLSDSY